MNHRTLALTLSIAALVLTRLVAATELPQAKPAAVGMSAEKLAQVAPAMKTLVDEGKVAGAITIVARQGKVVYLEAVGKQDITTNEPLRDDAIVRIYSMSKPITTVAAMMLVEEGKMGLDDPIAKHLPEFKNVQVFVGNREGEWQLKKPTREPTIRDLMRHTSGLTYGFFGDTPVDQAYRKADVLSADGTLADMATKLSKLPLLYQPGTRFNYSVSTDVLGRVVEVASGKTLDEFFQQRIFTPLDMEDTGFFVPKEKMSRFAANHGPKPGGGLQVIDAPDKSRYRNSPSLLSGGGGLVSTARDYLRFCQMLLGKGQLDGQRLLPAETVEAMTRNQLPDKAYPIELGGKRPGVGFGLGFSVIVENPEANPKARVGEFGWGGAASTHFWVSPKDDLAVVVLTQLMPYSTQMEDAVKPLVYNAVSANPARPAENLER